MAKQIGVRFSDREETQKGSKDSKAVTKETLTNKNDRVPSRNADYMKDMKSNVERMSSSDKPAKGAARASQLAAESRAVSRFAIGAGAPVAALAAGYGIGRIAGNLGGDEVVRKGIDKSGMGKDIDEASAPSKDRVKLTEEAKKRIESGELDKGRDDRVNKKDYPTYEKDTKSASTFREEFKAAKEDGKDSFTFEGRKYNTDEKPALAKGGYVNCGASVPPAQKAKK
jgi:hypothetical protein